MKKLKFEISEMYLQKNEFGKFDIIVNKIKVSDAETGKYIKFAKLNDALLKALKEAGEITIRNA